MSGMARYIIELLSDKAVFNSLVSFRSYDGHHLQLFSRYVGMLGLSICLMAPRKIRPVDSWSRALYD
jgi:hypothetical protein